jgi:nitrate reductase NapD
MTDREHHVSSAIVSALPGKVSEVARRIATLDGVEIRHVEGGKMIVLIEGPDAATIGGRLASIALMDGVLYANLAFEHVETLVAPEETR